MNREIKHYYFGGLNGSGKSTLVDKIAETDNGFEAVHSSRELMKWLGVERDYEAMRRMDQDEVLRQFARFIDQRLTDAGDKSLLFDTHYLSLVRGKWIDRTGEWIARFAAVILVTAPLADIWQRIQSGERNRALFPDEMPNNRRLGLFKTYAEAYEDKFFDTASFFGIPYLIINNPNGRLNEAADRFLDFQARH